MACAETKYFIPLDPNAEGEQNQRSYAITRLLKSHYRYIFRKFFRHSKSCKPAILSDRDSEFLPASCAPLTKAIIAGENRHASEEKFAFSPVENG
jgi:hypothetical protein